MATHNYGAPGTVTAFSHPHEYLHLPACMVHRHEQKWIKDYKSCELHMKIITMQSVYNAIKAHCGILKLLLSSLWIWDNLSPKICCKTMCLHIFGFQYIFMLHCCFTTQNTASRTACLDTYYTTQNLWWIHCGKVTMLELFMNGMW